MNEHSARGKLEQSDSLFQAIAEQSGEGISLTDTDGN